MTKRSDITPEDVVGVVETGPQSLTSVVLALGLTVSGTAYYNADECHVHGILSDAARVGVVQRHVVGSLYVYTIGREIG